MYLSAHAHSIAGQHAAAAVFAGRALQLSPNDPLAFEAHMALGEGAIRESRYEDAAECFARAARTNPKFSTAYFFRAMSQARAGHSDQAGASLRLGRELEPNFRTRMLFEIGMEPTLAHELAEGACLLGLSD
jgi:adenylate cyclase